MQLRLGTSLPHLPNPHDAGDPDRRSDHMARLLPSWLTSCATSPPKYERVRRHEIRLIPVAEGLPTSKPGSPSNRVNSNLLMRHIDSIRYGTSSLVKHQRST